MSLRPSEAQKEREVQELLKEAQTMLHKLTQFSSMRVYSDESVAQLDFLMKAADLNSEGALLDSGASHPFRMPNQGEVQNAQTVKVQLACGKEVLLRQNRAGTLMPVAPSFDENVAPIVPLRDLVQTVMFGLDVKGWWSSIQSTAVERANEEGHLRTILEGTAELRDWKDFLSAYVASGRRQPPTWSL